MSIVLNQAAPDFTLYNSTKTEVNLASLKGKNVLLLFFPLAFSGTCTAELCSVRDSMADYSALNAEIFGISVDSVFALARFKAEQNLGFELLSDFNKTVATAYNCLYPEFILGMKGVCKRSAFVIDKAGMLRYAEVLEKASDLPNFEAIKACLEQLK
ncbi:MAG TPA: redoxin domain-containing protein [Bacteroidia bacterium]|nr:redoxin domain-containing protein [Bacteroidia bacterium]